MRDILTITGGILITVLTALLVVPYFIDWEARRGLVEDALTDVTGAHIRTGGELRIRFLPAPRIYLEQLRVDYASEDRTGISLAADKVDTEINLADLLQGKIVFVEASIRRLELKVPYQSDADVFFQIDRLKQIHHLRAWSFENIYADQFFLTLENTKGKRIDQLGIEKVTLKSRNISGPWHIRGSRSGTAFSLATGELKPSGELPVKLSVASRRNLDMDGVIDVDVKNPDKVTAAFSGKLQLQDKKNETGKENQDYNKISWKSDIKSNGASLLFSNTRIELKDGAVATLDGSGTYDIAADNLSLNLKNRHMTIGSPKKEPEDQNRIPDQVVQTLLDGIIGIFPEWIHDKHLKLNFDQMNCFSEILNNVEFTGHWVRNDLSEYTLNAGIDNHTNVTFSAERGQTGWFGRIETASAEPQKLKDLLAKTDQKTGISRLFPFYISEQVASFGFISDFTVSGHNLALNNLKIVLDKGIISGMARIEQFLSPDRVISAQLGARHFTPSFITSFFHSMKNVKENRYDLSFEAREFLESEGTSKGRFFAHIVSAAGELSVKAFEVNNLWGANISLKGTSGKDSADWQGSIRAEHFKDMSKFYNSPWIEPLFRLLPETLLSRPVNLEVKTSQKQKNADGELSSVISISGFVDGDPVQLSLHEVNGALQEWSGEGDLHHLSAAVTGLADIPVKIRVTGAKKNNLHAFELSAVSRDLHVKTLEPVIMTSALIPDQGALNLASSDLRPLLERFGITMQEAKSIPLNVSLSFRQNEGETDVDLPHTVSVNGKIGSEPLSARIYAASNGSVKADLMLDRFSLPWFIRSFILNTEKSGLFGPKLRLPLEVELNMQALMLEMIPGYHVEKAHMQARLNEQGLHIMKLKGAFLSGDLEGSGSLLRDGGLAALAGELALKKIPLSALVKDSARFDGTMSLFLDFGAAADHLAGIINNLGGSGRVDMTEFRIAGLNENVFAEFFARTSDFPSFLDEKKLNPFIESELAKASLQALSFSAPLMLAAGELKPTGTIRIESPLSILSGSFSLDMKSSIFSAWADFSAKSYPEKWNAWKPALRLEWKSFLMKEPVFPDTNALRNALAEYMLEKETEHIRSFDQ